MKLTMKHMAIFGRVIVDLQGHEFKFFKCIDLYTMYKEGWFITERFGHLLCMCQKTRKTFKNKFFSFKTEVNLDTLDLLWKPLAEEQFEKYKKYLLENKRKKYTYKRNISNESNL